MRFNILVAAAFLITLAAGLVIPANDLASRDLEVREGIIGADITDIFVRANILKAVKSAINALKPTYHVPAGGGKPARASI